MSRIFRHKGDTIDFVLAGTVAADDILEEQEMLGVAATAGVSGDTIGVHVRGVFDVPKTGSETPVVGERLFYDGTAFTLTAATNRFGGLCARDAGAGDGTVWLNLNSGAIAGGV